MRLETCDWRVVPSGGRREAGDWELEARGRGLEGGDREKDGHTDSKIER